MITGSTRNHYRGRMPFLSGPIWKNSPMKNQAYWKTISPGLNPWSPLRSSGVNICSGPFIFIVVMDIRAMILSNRKKGKNFERNKLKILHLLSQRPDSTGSGIYVQAMLRESRACGHDNFLIAGIQSYREADLDCIDEDHCSFLKFYESDVSYHLPGMSDVMPYTSSRFCDLSSDELDEYTRSFSTIIQKAIQEFKPDLIHSHHLWVMTSLTKQLFPHIPLVATCHGSDLRQFQNCPHLQDFVLKGCRQIEAILALIESQKKEIIKLYRVEENKIQVIPPGYNDTLFGPTAKPSPNPVQLVYAGKLSKAKGVPWMLRALSTIDFPIWQLHLAGSGSGEEKEMCLQLAEGLKDRVLIHGAVPQEVFADIVRQSHIIILPSFYEGLPLVLLEGLAGGCRIVATDLPGVMELFRDFSSDTIQLVITPRLQYIDRPYPEDEKEFEQNLAQALRVQIQAACRQPQIDLSAFQDKIASFSWKSVFQWVEKIYYLVLIRKR
ncbi:MAG: glycosyl transferase family 1 [Desulfobacca sp.]|nr:glycosyl transferase family 1 [Desulfobacca sp.]